MIGNRLTIACLVVFLAVGPLHAEAFLWSSIIRPKTTTAAPVVETEASAVCPSDNDELVQFAHESNCSLFYKCNWGEKVVQECPAGLEYNSELEVCDYKESAGCSIPAVAAEEAVNEEAEAEEAADEEAAEDDEDSSDVGTEGCEGSCPEVDPESAVIISHVDPEKFCMCSNGVAYLYVCSEGLVFDKDQSVCNWPKSDSESSDSEGSKGPKRPKGSKRPKGPKDSKGSNKPKSA